MLTVRVAAAAALLGAAVHGAGNYGRAFVAFERPEDAATAAAAIGGRVFAGATLQAALVGRSTFDGVA